METHKLAGRYHGGLGQRSSDTMFSKFVGLYVEGGSCTCITHALMARRKKDAMKVQHLLVQIASKQIYLKQTT